MKKSLIPKGLLAVACSAILFSCKKDISSSPESQLSMAAAANSQGESEVNNANDKLYKGPEVSVGNGKSRSFFIEDKNGVPKEIGFEISNASLTGLPAGSHETSYLFKLHQKASDVTPFNHLVVDWNPNGHEPDPYLLPHFDFHFYMMSVAERLAIPSYETNPAAFDNDPGQGYLPAIYFAPPNGQSSESEMGKHWIDPSSPEISGGHVFDKTFIYGSYNGNVTFFEPMVTYAYVTSGVISSTAYPQPTKFAKHAYYPTRYNIYANSNGHYISLSGFVLR